jgi:hypothetical protein
MLKSFTVLFPLTLFRLCSTPTFKEIAQSALQIPTGSHSRNGSSFKGLEMGLEGMQGAEGEEEIADIMGKVLKSGLLDFLLSI